MMDWQQIINYGLPMVILAAIGVAIWRISWYLIHKVFGDETKGTSGLAGEWVEGEKEWRGQLTTQLAKQTERLEAQTEACTAHVSTVKAMGDSLAQQMSAAKLAQEAASVAAAAAAESNTSLRHIDEVLSGRTDLIRDTAEGVQDLKACAFHMCDLCQAFIAREFPGSAGEASAYLNAIKKKVNDETA